MARYSVCMSRSVIEYATVEVDAASELEARMLAKGAADEADWETAFDSYGDAEVVDVDEIEDDE